MGQAEDALRSFGRALLRDPDFTHAWLARARLCERLGVPCRFDYERFLELVHPADPRAKAVRSRSA